ncbi:MAG: hypothetical protein K2Z81_28905, partial [Cyanobacteria bacterium]|nr:hypothetical protein [Cyanobacteriota bacterium]
MTAPTPNFLVFYEHRPEGADALRFAKALIDRLNPKGTLTILLPQAPDQEQRNAVLEQIRRVKQLVQRLTG